MTKATGSMTFSLVGCGWCGSGGRTDDQFRGQDVVALSRVFGRVEQQLAGEAAALDAGLADRGEAGRGRLGDVVEAGHRYVAAGLEASDGQRVEHAEREHVRAGQDRGRPVPPVERE